MARLLLALAIGFTLAAAPIGCKKEEKQDYGDAEKPKPKKKHSHDEPGPNGGHIIELTEDHSYHAELTFDKDKRVMRLYFLGSDAKTYTPIKNQDIAFHMEITKDGKKEEMEIVLKPEPQKDDGDDKSSRFTYEDKEKAIPSEIDDIEKIHGHFHVTVDGKELVGEVEHDHGDE